MDDSEWDKLLKNLTVEIDEDIWKALQKDKRFMEACRIAEVEPDQYYENFEKIIDYIQLKTNLKEKRDNKVESIKKKI